MQESEQVTIVHTTDLISDQLMRPRYLPTFLASVLWYDFGFCATSWLVIMVCKRWRLSIESLRMTTCTLVWVSTQPRFANAYCELGVISYKLIQLFLTTCTPLMYYPARWASLQANKRWMNELIPKSVLNMRVWGVLDPILGQPFLRKGHLVISLILRDSGDRVHFFI